MLVHCMRIALPSGRFILPTAAFSSNLRSEEAVPLEPRLSYEEAAVQKEVDITTCTELYRTWNLERKYWTVPKSGLDFKVRYIDTGHSGDSKNPVVLSLHGSPGSYEEFTPLSKYLHSRGVRVIAPNFPGGNDLQLSVFRHTPAEKSEYIRDFLRVLRVPKVDMLLCHSSALFPGLHLCVENGGIPVNSLALLNPTGFDVPRLLKPMWLTKPLTRMCEFPLGYKITSSVGKRLANKPELKGGSFEEHLLSAVTLLNSSIPKKSQLFKFLLNQNFPILLAFSLNDKLIAKTTCLKMAGMMVDSSEVSFFDKNGEICSAGGLNPFRKVMAFERGSHFLLRTHPDVVSEAVASFLLQQCENSVKVQ